METKQESTQVQKSKHTQIFTLVKDKDGKVFIAAGQYRISTKKFDTFGQADQYIGTKPYELITNLIELAIYENEQDKQSAKRTKKTAKSKTENKENVKQP